MANLKDHSEGSRSLLDWLLFLILLAFTLPLMLPALSLYFSFDDLLNLDYYTKRPLWALTCNLFYWTSFRRPIGALLYLPSYYIFGTNPLPLYVTGLVLFCLNLALFFHLTRRLTGNRYVAALAAGSMAFHRENTNVWYNFGAVYELLAFTFMLSSLHLFMSFLKGEENRGRMYVFSILTFVLALNSKETAVVLPVVLTAYWFIYGWELRGGPKRGQSLHLLPYYALTVPYIVGKFFGEEAYWRDNPLYRYQFDDTAYHNLHRYLDHLVYGRIHFDDSRLAWTLLGTLCLALVLRNRHMLFGWCFSLLALAPVLPLPRVWGLFLYIPLAGVSLYGASFLAQVLGWLTGRMLPPWPWIRKPLLKGVALSLLFAGLLHHQLPSQRIIFRTSYFEIRSEWKQFGTDLFTAYPDLPEGTVLLFEGDPFQRRANEHWSLHLLIWLKYGRSIKVYRSPEQLDKSLKAGATAPEFHAFRFSGMHLEEVGVETLAPD